LFSGGALEGIPKLGFKHFLLILNVTPSGMAED
jgi:hypothetical protein